MNYTHSHDSTQQPPRNEERRPCIFLSLKLQSPGHRRRHGNRRGALAWLCVFPPISFSFHRIQNSLLNSHLVSAHDPSAPYHDPSSSPDNPKWSLVHVAFRQKLSTPITLKELKAWQGEKGHPLENMQMLKMSRISVSKVSAEEWNFLVCEMAKNGDIIKQ